MYNTFYAIALQFFSLEPDGGEKIYGLNDLSFKSARIVNFCDTTRWFAVYSVSQISYEFCLGFQTLNITIMCIYVFTFDLSSLFRSSVVLHAVLCYSHLIIMKTAGVVVFVLLVVSASSGDVGDRFRQRMKANLGILENKWMKVQISALKFSIVFILFIL